MTYHVELWNITQGLNPPLDDQRQTHLTRPRPTHAAYGPHVGASVMEARPLSVPRAFINGESQFIGTAYTSYAARL